ncbi:MAG: 2-amino-4-hydroxy-6-hydroxymethyldihydropteridine diphosphokinase [Hyphomicrobiales bacterium]|nr:2-amino-4-hydroxy-6-hydroxymethyldihydropteridine diphosphokinase [Hyphomicrobiales bacterium]MCP4998637.1 2-amino-4-hydroxy-6-hydroxymethyldihydropteridine diphosphokinase [Hyphomicrobiales bacterium]
MSPSDAGVHEALLGLGGNIGDPRASMASALQILHANDDIEVLAVSRLYRTPPWGKTDQDWFFNSCAKVHTTLRPHDLLDACLSVERQLKRRRRERWGPRIIDIDVLTYDAETIDGDGLSIPHPHMHKRAFVLLPLLDIEADVMVNGQTVSHWASLADSAGIEISSENGSWWLAEQSRR